MSENSDGKFPRRKSCSQDVFSVGDAGHTGERPRGVMRFSFVDLPTAERTRYERERASFSRARDEKLLPILVDLFVNQSACPVIN